MLRHVETRKHRHAMYMNINDVVLKRLHLFDFKPYAEVGAVLRGEEAAMEAFEGPFPLCEPPG